MKFEGQTFNQLNRKARLNILASCIIHTPFSICHYKLQSWTSSPTAMLETSIRQLYTLLWRPSTFCCAIFKSA